MDDRHAITRLVAPLVEKLGTLEKEVERLRARTLVVRPHNLTPIPDGGFGTTTSPYWVNSGIATTLLWVAAHGTQNYARVAFRAPSRTQLTIKALMTGTSTSEAIIIKTYKSSLRAGETPAWDTSNSTEQSSIAVATTLVEVTIASITPAAAGDVIVLGFRPRTTADGNVTSDKAIHAVYVT
jgi:hypothetical protein